MQNKEKLRKQHLLIPKATLDNLQPTGCRRSKDAEVAWRLGAAVDAARELRPKGILPIFGKAVHDDPQPKEMHIPLSEVQYVFLENTAREEGGSKGKMAREFLATADEAVKGTSGCLTHEGLVRKIVQLFLDST